jgi:predicted regulator of amino acid metabolism with ACT domain
MARDLTFMVANSMEAYCEKVMEIGVEKVAKHAGLKERVVRKFINDTYASKNADVRKIQEAVKAILAESEDTEKKE